MPLFIPPQSAAISPCPAPDQRLFQSLRDMTATRPGLVLECARMLRSEAQREYVVREAFLAAATRDPEAAGRHVSGLLGRKWLCDAGFFPTFNIARSLLRDQPGTAQTLMAGAARRYPGVALHEIEAYASLPFGAAVFEAAAEAAPGDAIGIAGGNSATANAVAAALRSSANPRLQILARMLSAPGAGPLERERAAVFVHPIASGALSVSRALEIAAGGRYFSEVVKFRMKASETEAALYDRVLEQTAQVLFRMMDGGSAIPTELRALEARDLYLMLCYGRTEQDDRLFSALFDGLLLPRLRGGGASALLPLIESTGDTHLRRFLSTAAAHRRLEPFLAAAGGPSQQAEVLGRCFRGLDRAARPLDEALAAGAVLDGIERPDHLKGVESTILAEYARTAQEQSAEGPAVYGLLAAAVSRRLPSSAQKGAGEIAARYQSYFRDTRILDSSALFDASGLCLQQHFFYDDDDGVESFASFRKAYQGQRNWKWEEHDGFVRVIGTGAGGRRIEIYANIPDEKKLTAPADNDSRHALARLLAEQGRAATVIVHRGHAYFVERTVRYIGPGARLVYLGSCRGLADVYSVMSSATRAQIIATRGVGTLSVNDPLLKALNDELLTGTKSIDWDLFWQSQERRFGRGGTFRDYLPPHRNGPARLMAAYFECLAAP